jgi:hypothetical protein
MMDKHSLKMNQYKKLLNIYLWCFNMKYKPTVSILSRPHKLSLITSYVYSIIMRHHLLFGMN